MENQKPVRTRGEIINTLKKVCTTYNTFLDVGCGDGLITFLAEDLGFRHLIAIDKQGGAENNYFTYLERKTGKTRLELVNDYQNLLKKYTFCTLDYKEFNFEEFRYDCILLNNFLHLIPDQEKYDLIERLYNLLEPEGVLYIKVNHNKHIDDTSPEKARNIGGNTWEGLNVWKEKRYLIDVEEFTAYLDSKYPILYEHCEHHAEKDEIYVLKKP